MGFFMFFEMPEEGCPAESTLSQKIRHLDLAMLPGFDNIGKIFRKGFWRPSQMDSLCFCGRDALCLAFADVFPFRFADKAEDLEH